MPISFYGRIVDENNQGMADVAVTFKISSFVGPPPREEKLRSVVVQTNSDGDFEFTSQRGDGFSIVSMRQDGKELAGPGTSTPTSFRYDNVTSRAKIPDTPAKRLVYPMRRKGSQISVPATVPSGPA